MSAVAWDVSDDRAQYSAAQQLHARHQRLWWVMWAPGARRFFAFYQGDAEIEPLRDTTPDGLDAQIRHTQVTIARTHPSAHWRCPVLGCTWVSVNPAVHTPCPVPR
ncbi:MULTISPECIES: hypothetical protein [unclassified Nocardiopsis]|uniref:hypothetical protein n=1 Tax=unclassified Nocardiopsis TaxID=2649073 RepID=UPI001F3B38EC|nr:MULTISPECIES: hypothetical protein [unclassified Nocardiopsis]